MKQGLLRTLEAVLAIIAILGFLFFLLPEGEVPETGAVPKAVEEAQRYILAEISLNSTYRDCITGASGGIPPYYEGACQGGCLHQLDTFVKNSAPFGYTATCEICSEAISCQDLSLPLDKSVYTDSIFISKQLPTKQFNTKVLRVYMYEA